MTAALLLGANTSSSCLSSLQTQCNFFFFFKEKCHSFPSPPTSVFVFVLFFFKLRINVYLPDICARRKVFSILFLALSLIPWFSALLLIYALVCVPSESRGSVVLLLLDLGSFLKVTVSQLCFKPMMPLHLLSIIWKFVIISYLLMSILLLTCYCRFIPFCCFTIIFLGTR